ncbi:MAG: tRNA guanosine(15) transglycosylase TgtA [Nitrososphaerota archaeon]|nr:tRNA guanosine(15) transglycosylase TgtA [Candidatus Bathyarchaeota archaeon]MDW8023504.1 tRNA guanosine(15) transglycosylase TgtA [Nitrososphaerota archaeon]
MAFEVKDRDLLARIGRLHTKSGTVETPLLFPVINPNIQLISPREIRENFGFEALITNAYILKKNFQNQPVEKGVHGFLGFDGVVMTDSGAYQILVYGGVEVTPEEIVEYQERINTDIATILDWPTGWNVSRKHAEQTVNETLNRARTLFKVKTREDVLWVGPVQGGRHLDLVAKSAFEMGRLPFQIYALGSPTEVMERYRFDILVDMIMAAKMSLPVDKPFHLFGAGHPLMFSLVVALGCDLFDSAAYAIYARDNRYLTGTGTARLEELEYFPCSCPKCLSKKPKEVAEMPNEERQRFLAEHNLYACLSEIKRVKQAIREGRLWEHLEAAAHGHPALLQALKRLRKYERFIERHSPTVKRSGLFFFSSLGLARPEVVRYRIRLAERYSKPGNAEILLLMPQTRTKPFHKSREFRETVKILREALGERLDIVHFCFYEAPFGVVPIELDEVYPLSQNESALPPDKETVGYVASHVADYIAKWDYRAVLLLYDRENWGDELPKVSRRICSARGVKFKYLDFKGNWINAMSKFLKNALREKRSTSLDSS